MPMLQGTLSDNCTSFHWLNRQMAVSLRRFTKRGKMVQTAPKLPHLAVLLREI